MMMAKLRVVQNRYVGQLEEHARDNSTLLSGTEARDSFRDQRNRMLEHTFRVQRVGDRETNFYDVS